MGKLWKYEDAQISFPRSARASALRELTTKLTGLLAIGLGKLGALAPAKTALLLWVNEAYKEKDEAYEGWK